MGPLSRKEWIGILTILGIVTLCVGMSALRSGPPASPSAAVTLRQAAPPVPIALPPLHSPLNSASATASPETAAIDREETPGSPTALALHAASEEVVVHVAGAVRHPGVYHLRPGARNDDALKAAGGPANNANTDAVNLAAKVEDGTQLYIPTRKERPDGGAIPTVAADNPSSPPALAAVPPARHSLSIRARSARAPGSGSSRSGKLSSPEQGQIDLNTASAEELQRLPGVGPAMAARLIAFRQQNGGFRKVEDLLQVSGIGAKKFAKMQPYVRIK